MDQGTTKITDVPDDVLKIIYRYKPEMLPRLGLTSKEIAKVSNKVLCEQPITEKEVEKFIEKDYNNFALIDLNSTLLVESYLYIYIFNKEYITIIYDVAIYDLDEMRIDEMTALFPDLIPKINQQKLVNIVSTEDMVPEKPKNITGDVTTKMFYQDDILELDLFSRHQILKNRSGCHKYENYTTRSLFWILEDRHKAYKSVVTYEKYIADKVIDIAAIMDFYRFIYLNCRMFNIPYIGIYQDLYIHAVEVDDGYIILPTYDEEKENYIEPKNSYDEILKLVDFIDKFYPLLYNSVVDLGK